MKTRNETHRDSERIPYQTPSVSVYAIAYPMSILNSSDPEPTEEEIVPAF